MNTGKFITYNEVLKTYFDYRKHKRNKKESLLFELNYEYNVYMLYLDLNNGVYNIGKSICFCVDKHKLIEDFKNLCKLNINNIINIK